MGGLIQNQSANALGKMDSKDLTSWLEILRTFQNVANIPESSFNDIKAELTHLFYLKHAFDESIIIGMTDIKGRIMYVNDLFMKISGYSKEELIGQNHSILNSGYHSKGFFREMWRTISSGQKWEGEIKNRAKDGSFYWVKTSIIPVVDDSGKPTCYISARTDITEGKIAQESLYVALQEEYRKVVQALENMVFKIKKDDAGKMQFSLFAGKLAKRLGLSNESFLNKTPEEIFTEEQAKIFNKQFTKAFEGESLFYKQRLGTEFTLFISLSPLIEDGEVVELVGTCSDISDLEKANEKINFLAYHDPVTRLPNKKRFDDDLSLALNVAKTTNQKLAVLCVRVNGINKVNELFGPSMSEVLLKKVVGLLNEHANDAGRIYRIEGNRFLIIVSGYLKEQELEQIAYAICQAIEKVHRIHEHEFRLTCHIGASTFPEYEEVDELLNSTFKALHYCRLKKNNVYQMYTKEVHDYFLESLSLERALKQAIQNDELTLYYQPKIDIQTNKLVGMEVLLRWFSKELGFISPATFIPLAEETGLIFSLGDWVLSRACAQQKKWMDKGFPNYKVAVNLSPLELQHSQFTSRLQGILERTGLPPENLEIEITENSIMEDTDASVTLIQELREMGLSIAIDDFGTGYSSLGYLKKFPVNTLKIDQSFVKDILCSTSDAQLVKAMLGIARAFHLTVVAEGVETEEVANFLKEIGCEQVQGYYFSRPLPAEEFEQLYLNE
ncbi:EAL domain-containing protein [Bacillus tianshenii]|nr:EAL domain-containing protein [Bacillus tianshenii]